MNVIDTKKEKIDEINNIKLKDIKSSIESYKKDFVNDYNYIDDISKSKLKILTVNQANIAFEYGIPIAICSNNCDYHGSTKGMYSYSLVFNQENMNQELKDDICKFKKVSIHCCLTEELQLK